MDHCMRDLYFYTRLSGYFPSFDRNCALIWSGGTSSDRKRETDQSVLRDFGPLRGTVSQYQLKKDRKEAATMDNTEIPKN